MMLAWLLNWFSETQLWRWFARDVIGHFTTRIWGYPSFPMSNFHLIRLAMERDTSPGVFVFSSCDTRSIAGILIRWVTGGKFSHSGVLHLDSTCGIPALHIQASGLTHGCFLDVLRQVDVVSVVKYDMTEGNLALASKRMRDILDRGDSIKYAFPQKLGGNDLYCSELVYLVLEGLAGAHALQPSNVLGRKAFSPDDAIKYGRPIFEHKERKA